MTARARSVTESESHDIGAPRDGVLDHEGAVSRVPAQAAAPGAETAGRPAEPLGSGVPPVVVEVLRFCVVVFLAGVGYQVAHGLDSDRVRMGPFDAEGTGIILGAAFGYVLGGVVGRLTGRTLTQTERALRSRSAEQVLAGLTGAVLGTLLAAGLAWPMLLVGSTSLTIPVFVFVCVTVATLGYRVGMAQRERVLSLLGPSAGIGGLHGHVAPVATLARMVDTSVAIDGRVLDVVRAGFLHGTMLVSAPVVAELQGLADAGDDLRRAKGRRGLETLEALRRERSIDVEYVADLAPEVVEVDAKLVRMCLDRPAALLTLDTNLAKAAALSGCRVMNLHALALALRPPVTAGDTVSVLLTRPGKEAGQAVGYLDDGTMVVVEKSRERVGTEVGATVTSVLVTANGRLVFARLT
ncbi:PIN/TRAM domain-containing protein [Kineosporia sp. R_H_3]|uniref:PIN/TRAM domain-containing protein n=1 Tax=Kineosporia sp. R_H_3 TaxID=1961848 RepID=UPI00117A9446|nr:TRAM domain-containing protein [Kineosporia sp. R_H_3]